MNPEIKRAIKDSVVLIQQGRYAYLKTKEKSKNGHFLVTQDKDEVTVIAEESNVPKISYEQIVKWFKLIEIKVSKPFEVVGFLATITKAIADKSITVLIVSTFSKDYLLIREEHLDKAIHALQELGFPIESE
ncbi:ACT domain-containing protein [Candidatus Woesearchaeota archaeon]|nr:ACT domain-containing protein [Candidatus Woesearchaeota archaeon]